MASEGNFLMIIFTAIIMIEFVPMTIMLFFSVSGSEFQSYFHGQEYSEKAHTA
jgi:hypothetical protein